VQEAQTYLSRDGGWSWSQVNKWTIQIWSSSLDSKWKPSVWVCRSWRAHFVA
jgi:hypothetical protein